MSNKSLFEGSPIVTAEIVRAATIRARRERSDALWAMLQTLFGRKDVAAKTVRNDRPARVAGQRMAPAAGAC